MSPQPKHVERRKLCPEKTDQKTGFPVVQKVNLDDHLMKQNTPSALGWKGTQRATRIPKTGGV